MCKNVKKKTDYNNIPSGSRTLSAEHPSVDNSTFLCPHTHEHLLLANSFIIHLNIVCK